MKAGVERIERLITRIIESSETLSAEKTCVEKDVEPAYAVSVDTMANFGFEWIPATDPRSKTHTWVECALGHYVIAYTDKKIEASWDETLDEFLDENRDMLSGVISYARSYAEMRSVMERMRYKMTHDSTYDLDGMADAVDAFAKYM